VSAHFDFETTCQYHTHHDIQCDSRLVDITVGVDFLGLYEQKKININMGPILNVYGVMVVF